MEKCVHVSKIRPAWDHSILNPEKWLCFSCRTTESVWACLSCSNVACGRFNEQHALKHFKESKHPISIEVNDKYVYCYVCDDYVLNDNAAGDLKLLRSALSAIATQKFTDIESRGRRLLRSYSHTGVIKRDLADDDDKVATADWHQRQRLLGRVFGAWRTYVSDLRLVKKKSSKRTKNRPEPSTSLTWKKRRIQPGVTGLRNLGNTCYMNSVLQVLSHINAFRDFFLSLKDSFYSSPGISPQVSSIQLSNKPAVKSPPTKPSSKLFIRQSTVECFEHLMSTRSQTQNPMPQKKVGGLNGGSSSKSISGRKPNIICEVESKGSDDKIVSLCSELHGLFRVLWSGKWTQVSPHAFLRAVWQGIPLFKGYAQHDAQEFLCELLDKVQREMDCVPPPLRREDAQLVTELFQGELVSQVTCMSCGNQSQTKEPFLDLSLEFPDRYQITKQNSRIAQDVCHLTEMLAKFTEVEHLEGPIYACEKCNSKRGKQKEKIYTEAKKQLLINRLPQILRLHLKRFRWSGRNHREKISTHVAVDENLNLAPFSVTSSCSTSHEYQLFAVIIHHGKGFGSGHYTAYTYNPHAECWVNCNDSRMILSSIDDVLLAQAYILFYRAVTNKLPLLTRLSSSNCSLASSTDTLPYDLVTDSTLILDKADSEVSEKQTRGSNTSKPYNSTCKQPVKKRRQHRKDSLDRLSKSESVVKTDSVFSVDRDGNEEDYVEIDSEVSFKSNSSSFTHIDLTDSSFGQHSALGLKRKHEDSKDSPEPPPKKKQKMSISTEAFYTPKPEGSSDGGSRGSRFMSSFGSKLSDFISKLSKQCEKSPPRVKRTKSSFW